MPCPLHFSCALVCFRRPRRSPKCHSLEGPGTFQTRAHSGGGPTPAPSARTQSSCHQEASLEEDRKGKKLVAQASCSWVAQVSCWIRITSPMGLVSLYMFTNPRHSPILEENAQQSLSSSHPCCFLAQAEQKHWEFLTKTGTAWRYHAAQMFHFSSQTEPPWGALFQVSQ